MIEEKAILNETILGLVDTDLSFFGSCKEGFAFCFDGIYWRNSEKKTGKLLYDNFSKCNFVFEKDNAGLY